MKKPAVFRIFPSVVRYPVAENFIIANRVLIDAAAIAGVALDGVDNAVFDFLDNTDMICRSVLRARAALIIPIEEDNHARRGLHGIIRPLASIPEPLDAVDTSCELRNDADIDVSTFICAPADEAGTPLHTAAKAVP